MESLEYWLALVNVPGIWPLAYARLLARFQEPRRMVEAGESELRACGLKEEDIAALKNPNIKQIERQRRWAEQPGHFILTLDHAEYPALLKNIPDPPPVLFVKGQTSLLGRPQVAMIGSRNPSWAGLERAREFSGALAKAGLVITSGLALGIDAACHRGALDEGGMTIAVLGSGLERVYPPRNRALAEEIGVRGALVSEFPLDTAPAARHFPRRNRIISGLSLGALVVEATLKSGSLITAKLALEQGREVFAIPDSIRNPLAAGCHALIQQGAKLAAAPADVLTEFQHGLAQCCIIPPKPELDSSERQLLECVGFEAVSVDCLAQRSGWPVEKVTAGLVALELRGYVLATPRGYFRKG